MKTLFIFALFLFVSTVLGQTEPYYPTRYTVEGESQYLKPQQIPVLFPITPYQLPTNERKGGVECFNNVYFVRHNTTFIDVLPDAGNFYLSGHCHRQTNNPYDSLAKTVLVRMKTDSIGNVVWVHEDSLINGEHFRNFCHSIIKLSDGSLLATGHILYDFKNLKDYEYRLPIYQRFTQDGNLIFSKLIADTVGRRFGFWPQDVVPEPDMGFSVAGFVGSQTRTWNPQLEYWQHDTTYIAIIQYDSLGNEIRRALHYVGGEPRTPGVDGLMKLADGGYIINGTQLFNYPASPLRNNYILHIDSNLNFVSVNTFGQMIGELYMQHHIRPSKNGGYCFAVNLADTPLTQTAFDTYYTYYYHVGRMDSAFNITHDTVFRVKSDYSPYNLGAGIIMGLSESLNMDIVVSVRYGSGAHVFWLNDNLDLYRVRYLWHYPGQYPAGLHINHRQANDGGILLVGANLGTHRGGWFVKTDTLGYSLPHGGDTLMHIGIEMYGTHHDLITELFGYPNPVTETFTLRTKNNTPLPQGTLQIFNLHGVLQQEIAMPAYQHQIQLNLSHLPAGLYMGRIVCSGGGGGVFKFVKE